MERTGTELDSGEFGAISGFVLGATDQSLGSMRRYVMRLFRLSVAKLNFYPVFRFHDNIFFPI